MTYWLLLNASHNETLKNAMSSKTSKEQLDAYSDLSPLKGTDKFFNIDYMTQS